LRIATSSSGGGLVDPLQVDAQTLGELLEASDLSPHPGLALERVLEEPAETPRDVVLLTHPRNLAEEDVAAAARRVRPGTRLFALSGAGRGRARPAEVNHGPPINRSQFHVDLPPAAPPAPAAKRRPGGEAEASTPWSGDVEPIGFPFRFGVG